MSRNILWNSITGQVMMIDFERAEILKPRPVLGVISPNRKRKRVVKEGLKKQQEELRNEFVREIRRAIVGLRGL